jgi:hypothetical protein
MTPRACAAALASALLVLLLSGCPPKQPLGYSPPPADDPLAAFKANWAKFKLVSGQYKVAFRYSDGQKVTLRADMIVENGDRSRVDLSSDRGSEAVVIISPDFINLLNQRERYYVREENTPENAGRLVGLYLPPREVAAVLSGRGLDSNGFTQLYREPDGDGGVRLLGFHEKESLRVTARIDAGGRLLSARYTQADTDEPIVDIRYLAFRLDGAGGLVWPTHLEIDLLRSGDKIILRAGDVDINPVKPDLDFLLSPRQLGSGERLRLEDVPPGPPLLYRSAKEYVR